MAKGSKGKSPSRDSITVFYATNRARLGDAFGENVDQTPGAERRLWLGSVEVECLNKPEATEASRLLAATPATTGLDDFLDPDAGDCARVLDTWLAAAAARDALPLLFIHGFSNRFDSAVQRCAQLTEFYGAAGLELAPLAFCWPSDGKVIGPVEMGGLVQSVVDQYRRDQSDAAQAAPALARLLAELRRARSRAAKAAAGKPGQAGRMALLAHSMGNHALACGLLSLGNGLMTRDMVGLFDEAVLVSADVSAQAFSQGKSLRMIGDLARRTTIAISYDSTLCVASEIANGNRRLGHAGPADLATLPPNIEVVDYWTGLEAQDVKDKVCESVPGGGTAWDVVDHQWYRNDRNARADLALVLAGEKPKGRLKLPPERQTEARRSRHFSLT